MGLSRYKNVDICTECLPFLYILQSHSGRWSSTIRSRSIFSLPFLFSACSEYVPESSTVEWWMTRVVVAPPWYSSISTVKFSLEVMGPWTGWVQVKTGGGSPRHLICQKAVRLTRTILEP